MVKEDRLPDVDAIPIDEGSAYAVRHALPVDIDPVGRSQVFYGVAALEAHELRVERRDEGVGELDITGRASPNRDAIRRQRERSAIEFPH